MTNPGDIAPRRDTDQDLYVVVLSNAIHLAAGTGRVVTCPYIPGRIPDDSMAMVVAVKEPDGVALPELIQWLPIAALDDTIGNVGAAALRETAALAAALIAP